MASAPSEYITCDLCGKATLASGEDILVFGEWMRRTQLTVHYFCLLLSTHLQQRGCDTGGIMGFLVRDIRKEVAAARKRICYYCGEPGATIQCATCGRYFDLVCTVDNRCTTQFSGRFVSYCHDCPPMDEYRQQLVDRPPHGVTCDICMNPIVLFQLNSVIFPECCRLGFVHKKCMRQYAASSGYYLTCIWCRSTQFREAIRMQGIFVPDRDAEWERQRHAFRELHRRTLRCEEDECLSSHGRDYNKHTWRIIACKVCGSAGAHTRCLARSMQLRRGTEPSEFTCSICQEVEKKLEERAEQRMDTEEQMDTPELPATSNITETECPMFSEDDADNSLSSTVITVIPNHRQSTESSSNDCASSIVSPPQAEAIESRESPAQAKVIELNDDSHSQPAEFLELRESFSCPGEPFFYLVIYEFDEHGTCKGSCTLRFDEQDPRIKDRSEEALMRVKIRPEDVWFRNKDCGVYGIVHKYTDMHQH